MARARTAVTTVMASSSETELKEKRRKAARTLLSKDWEYKPTVDEAARSPKPYRRAHDKRIPAERRRHLVDGVYVDKLPFNAGEQLRTDPYPDLSTAGLIASNQYDNPHSGGRKPVIIAEQVEPAVKKQTCNRFAVFGWTSPTLGPLQQGPAVSVEVTRKIPGSVQGLVNAS